MGVVLSMYDVKNRVGRVERIQNRSHEAIIPKIEENIEAGTEDVTDELTRERQLP